jgi:hypothetical protein
VTLTALHVTTSCPPAAEPALTLARELGELDADAIERALAYDRAVPRGAKAQLRSLAHPTVDDPLLAAILLAERGRRAGLPIGLVAGATGYFVAHQRLTEPLVLDPSGQLVDATARAPLLWRCGHQVAAELLDTLQPRYERANDLTRALHVARARCALPFEDAKETRRRLGRLTARLN